MAAAVRRLVELGQLDDERFARLFAGDKRELQGWGPERIRQALEERGLPGPIVESAVGDEGRSDQVERARALLERRGAQLGDDAGRSRALGFLTRRGYDYEVAYEAIRRAA